MTVISVAGRRFEIGVHSRSELPIPSALGDVWLPVALFAAMSVGLPLVITDPVSRSLATRVPTIQRIYSTWFSEFSVVPVRTTENVEGTRLDPLAAATRTAQFFTGGVDSFYTLGSHSEASVLLYQHDLVHDVPEVRDRISNLLPSISSTKNVRLIEFDSDVRSMLDQYGEWGSQTHGAVLASVASLCSGIADRVLIPASHTYLELAPWGSHPLIDPLWGGDSLELVHDGAHASRFDKIEAITHDTIALRNLRVCWQTTTQINCSRCEKCLRTMTSLELLGVLRFAPTFRPALDLSSLAELVLQNESDASFTFDNLRAAQRLGRADIAAALSESLRIYAARAS